MGKSAAMLFVLLTTLVLSLGNTLALPSPSKAEATCPASILQNSKAQSKANADAVKGASGHSGGPSNSRAVRRMNDQNIQAADARHAVQLQGIGFHRLQLVLGSNNQQDVQDSGLTILNESPNMNWIYTFWGQHVDTSDSPQLPPMIAGLSSMLLTAKLVPNQNSLHPWPAGPFKAGTWLPPLVPLPGKNNDGLTVIVNVVDGIIIRGRGPYNRPTPNQSPRDNAFMLESAAVTTLFFRETGPHIDSWRTPWGLQSKSLAQQRQKLKSLIDAFVEDRETLQIIKNIDQQQGGPGLLGAIRRRTRITKSSPEER